MSPKKTKTVPTRPQAAASKSTVNDVQRQMAEMRGMLRRALSELGALRFRLYALDEQLQRSQRR